MNAIGKECSKELKERKNLKKNKELLESCIKASKVLHELNLYINTYKRDCDCKAEIKSLSYQIRSMDNIEKLESEYGALMFHCRISWKRINEADFKGSGFLMCFTYQILIFDVEQNKKNLGDYLCVHHQPKNMLTHVDSIKVTKWMLLLDKIDNKKHYVLTVCSLDPDLAMNNRKSFSILVKRKEEFDTLKEKFQDLIDTVDADPCEKHDGHKFHKQIPKHEIDLRDPLPPSTCGECGLYIFGSLLMGYKCETCQQLYHDACFLKGESDPTFGKPNFDICIRYL